MRSSLAKHIVQRLSSKRVRQIEICIRDVWSKSSPTHDQIMLWAAFTLAFFGFLKSGKICSPSDKAYHPSAHLSFTGDVAIDHPQNPSIMCVHLKTSKTDPFRKGVDIFLGRTHDLCPISAMLAYLAVRGGAEGLLFQFRNGLLLTRDCPVVKLREGL